MEVTPRQERSSECRDKPRLRDLYLQAARDQLDEQFRRFPLVAQPDVPAHVRAAEEDGCVYLPAVLDAARTADDEPLLDRSSDVAYTGQHRVPAMRSAL